MCPDPILNTLPHKSLWEHGVKRAEPCDFAQETEPPSCFRNSAVRIASFRLPAPRPEGSPYGTKTALSINLSAPRMVDLLSWYFDDLISAAKIRWVAFVTLET